MDAIPMMSYQQLLVQLLTIIFPIVNRNQIYSIQYFINTQIDQALEWFKSSDRISTENYHKLKSLLDDNSLFYRPEIYMALDMVACYELNKIYESLVEFNDIYDNEPIILSPEGLRCLSALIHFIEHYDNKRNDFTWSLTVKEFNRTLIYFLSGDLTMIISDETIYSLVQNWFDVLNSSNQRDLNTLNDFVDGINANNELQFLQPLIQSFFGNTDGSDDIFTIEL
jgi:hypothetical protein